MRPRSRLAEVKDKIGIDAASYKEGVYTVRRQFFYRHGKTEGDLVRRVQSAFPVAKIEESGEVWKPFHGDATVAQGSHWYVKFTLPEAK